jgi:hypothetical protein
MTTGQQDSWVKPNGGYSPTTRLVNEAKSIWNWMSRPDSWEQQSKSKSLRGRLGTPSGPTQPIMGNALGAPMGTPQPAATTPTVAAPRPAPSIMPTGNPADIGPRGGEVTSDTMGLGYRVAPGGEVSKTMLGQPMPMGGNFSVMDGRVTNDDGTYSYRSADGRGIFTRKADGPNGQLGELVSYSSPTTEAAKAATQANGSAPMGAPPSRSPMMAAYDRLVDTASTPWWAMGGAIGRADVNDAKQRLARTEPAMIAADASAGNAIMQAGAEQYKADQQATLGRAQLSQNRELAEPKYQSDLMQNDLWKRAMAGDETAIKMLGKGDEYSLGSYETPVVEGDSMSPLRKVPVSLNKRTGQMQTYGSAAGGKPVDSASLKNARAAFQRGAPLAAINQELASKGYSALTQQDLAGN